MNYGLVSKQTRMAAGKIVQEVVVYEESLQIHTDIEAAELWYDMLADLRQGKLVNPGLQVEVYPDTGKIKRVVKCWTEVR